MCIQYICTVYIYSIHSMYCARARTYVYIVYTYIYSIYMYSVYCKVCIVLWSYLGCAAHSQGVTPMCIVQFLLHSCAMLSCGLLWLVIVQFLLYRKYCAMLLCGLWLLQWLPCALFDSYCTVQCFRMAWGHVHCSIFIAQGLQCNAVVWLVACLCSDCIVQLLLHSKYCAMLWLVQWTPVSIHT